VRAIRDHADEVIAKRDGNCERALKKDIAHAATALLQGPIENGTASTHGQIGRPAAGKTGTTTDNKDAWFVGYIPQLSAATWVGHEMPKTLVHPLCGEVTGGCLPTILWQRFMTKALDVLELPVESFPEPPPPPVIPIPSVVDMDQETAEQTLVDAGFIPHAEEVDDVRPAGTVVAQSPAGGESAPESTTITISVSNGRAQPDLPELPDLPDLPDLPGGGPPDGPIIFPPGDDLPFDPPGGPDQDDLQ
jgi:membrane peptidoglycan carboxypeptidase